MKLEYDVAFALHTELNMQMRVDRSRTGRRPKEVLSGTLCEISAKYSNIKCEEDRKGVLCSLPDIVWTTHGKMCSST